MMTTEHPYVEEYLAGFDARATRIPDPRRSVLREEIAAHLRDAVPVDSTDADAAAVIAAFGSPAEIIGQELGDPPAAQEQHPRHALRITLIIVATVVVVALAVAAGLAWLYWAGPSPQSADPASPSPSAASSIVNETPRGPLRVTSGEAYYEYEAAIESMEHPLPTGAAYPLGVPEGLDAGAQPSGALLESGAGRNVAYFSWLCAWESEYLSAIDADDDRRRVDAESMITAWSTSGFHLAMGDDEGGWTKNVVDPMKFGDPSGVKQDLPSTCAQAFIVNVNAR
ncbi:hypothetical protein BH11ACT4_BH11ACT4_14390 [soil metagenome]